ncbi:hypothetical protein J7L84_02355 [Candidatus Bipolaricaulota bacterium]|nr:hypothetical protein [Candidatus Bipolaricaulota bacterium]
MITEIPELRKLMANEGHDLRDCLKAEEKGKMGYEHREVSERPYGQGVGGIEAPSFPSPGSLDLSCDDQVLDPLRLGEFFTYPESI